MPCSRDNGSRGDGLVMILTGDSTITRRWSMYREAAFLELIDLIRRSDVAFTNIETLFHDYESFPMHESGGTYMRSAPELAGELVWAGFNLGSLANNHAGDYGVEGLRLTIRHLEAAGLLVAGAGEDLHTAREARFLETDKARVALVAVASTFTEHSCAGRSRGGIPARPGISFLRHTKTIEVSRDAFEAGADIVSRLHLHPQRTKNELLIPPSYHFVVGTGSSISSEPLPKDLAEIVAVVSHAARLADYTIVSIHAHESDRDPEDPPRFLTRFAHAVIDGGADVVVGHGPHRLRGVEIYDGKPVFYSLGNFISQAETVFRQPAESFEPYGLGSASHEADLIEARHRHGAGHVLEAAENWRSVAPRLCFLNGELKELTLHPVTLSPAAGLTARGRPRLAKEEAAREIIADLARLSAAWQTEIAFRDEVGRVCLRS